MSRQFYFWLTAFVTTITTYVEAQTSIEYSTGQNVRIYAPNFKPYDDVEGSPFIPGDSVQKGWLMYGQKRVPARLRYNSYTGEVEYVEGSKVLIPVTSVVEFVIVSPDTLHFRKGFPNVGSWSPTDFYQLLYDGRSIKLIKRMVSVIKSNTETMSNDFGKKRFQQREEYYVWVASVKPPSENYAEKLSDGTMKSVVASKKSLLSIFPEKAGQIDHYLSDQKLKLKSWKEFASVLRYLETI